MGVGEICDAIEAFQKVAGKPKRKNTLRSIPKDLVNSMDTVCTAYKYVCMYVLMSCNVL